jgi:hypothetical protein
MRPLQTAGPAWATGFLSASRDGVRSPSLACTRRRWRGPGSEHIRRCVQQAAADEADAEAMITAATNASERLIRA